MKFREIFRFEFAYQLRRVSTWLYFAVLLVLSFLMLRFSRPTDESYLDAPSHIAFVTVFGSLIWLLIAAAVAGDAAARDVETRMYSLTYTTPISKVGYLGGRFLAAFALNALIQLAIPAGVLLAFYSPGAETELLGPFRPAAYLSAYGFIALPIAFVATAIQFSLATLSRWAIASYISSVLLLVTSQFVSNTMALIFEWRELAKLMDLIGITGIVGEFENWRQIETNTRLIALEGTLLWNRLLWFGIALGILAFTYHRFRFAHYTASTSWWSRITQRRKVVFSETLGKHAHSPQAGSALAGNTPISVPQVRRTFGFVTNTRQTLEIARTSFRTIATSRSGLTVVAAIAIVAVIFAHQFMENMGVPLFPRTAHFITFLTTPLGNVQTPLVIIPLLIVFYAGELIWREREAGLSEIAGAVPVPEWVLFLGKFLGLGLILVVWLSLLMATGMLMQVNFGYYDFEIGLYLQTLFGLQLIDYLLFALLALVLHVLVNQKYIGHLVSLIVFAFIAFASRLGIEHNLLIYGSDPGWSYTDMRGFGPFLAPWLWFKLYWTAWALLLGVAASLFWARSRERGLKARFQLARGRFTLPTAWAAAAAVGLILTLGGFIFYNTNVLNEYSTASERMERRAEYERRYGQYEGIPQPRLTGTNLHLEIYPKRREVEIRGTYRLVNSSSLAIDTIHLATASEVGTGEVEFDRPTARVLADGNLGHRIYALEEALQPGDSLRLSFEVHFEPEGFRNSGADASVLANGTHFTNLDWLLAIGYQPHRELNNDGERRAYGLAPRPAVPSLDDVEARQDMSGAERIAFDAVVGTDEDQIAIAPGALRRTWTEGGRRYFHYVTDAPIQNEYAFFSADYAVHEGQWNDPSAVSGQVVAIRIFHHPGHTANLDRLLRSVEASLNYYTEQFGPYPYRHISFVEHPGLGGMHANASMITFQEGFSLFNLEGNSRAPDFPFSVVAHEVAHQWWGIQLAPANVEGSPLLSESLAEYSAFQVVKKTYGQEHLRRYLRQLRTRYEFPSTRVVVPLLRSNDPFLAYYKGPFALHALSEYIGEERVNTALRRLLEKHGSGTPSPPTSLDLYRELQAVTPDTHQYLLHDLFEANTFWELETKQAAAEQTEAGTWQVTLDVRARKMVVDEAGVETPVPMDDWVEVRVFAPAEKGDGLGEPLYVHMHRIGSGKQTITVTVPRKPAYAGIDPRYLLIDLKTDDNVEKVKMEQ